MKPSQWIVALLLLAAMVFVVTFALNYTPGTSSPSDGPGNDDGNAGVVTGDWLSFAEPQYPRFVPLEYESAEKGSHDFWFVNRTDKRLKAGLNGFSCTICLHLEAFVLPGTWGEHRNRLTAAVAEELLAGGDGVVRRLAAELTGLQAQASGLVLDGKNEVTVEPGAAGWFRLHWDARPDRKGVLLDKADLWGGKPGMTKTTLEMRLFLIEPLRVAQGDTHLTLNLDPNQLPHTRLFHVWSSTRDHLTLETTGLGPRSGASDADPVQIGQPQPLTAEQCRELERQHYAILSADGKRTDVAGRVRCAYRIPVKVQAKAADGVTPLEIGTFRRHFELACADRGVERVSVTIEGNVRAPHLDVDGQGRVDFGSVRRSRGAEQSVAIRSSEAGLELTVDESRLPRFLKAELSKPEVRKVNQGESRTWTLRVEVLPNKAGGEFPRDDNEVYRDSAVYLKLRRTSTTPGRGQEYLRIAVKGVVIDG